MNDDPPKSKGLGRGLASLLSDDVTVAEVDCDDGHFADVLPCGFEVVANVFCNCVVGEQHGSR